MRRSSTTWTELRTVIMRRISDGMYQPGQLIPTEMQLSKEFGCARATVNRALTSLAQRGVLERRRRIGTRVALDAQPGRSPVRMPGLRDLIESTGQRVEFRLIDPVEGHLAAEARDRLLRSDPQDIVETRALVMADGKLFCIECRWHDAAALPELMPAMRAGAMANDWMRANRTASMVETDVSARTADLVGAAQHLNCPPGAPVLVFETCIWIGDRPVSYALHVLPPGESVPTGCA